MKKISFTKAITAVLVLLISAVSLTMEADVTRKIKIVGPDAKTTLQVFDTSIVSYIEVTDETDESTYDVYPNATIAKNGDILIELTPELIFKMVRVEGGVDYTLNGADIAWTEGKTKKIDTFYIGQFEVTQGLWKNVKGGLPTGGTQSKIGDDCPVAYVSWDAIAGSEDDTFLKLINAKLAEIKQNNPSVAALLGNREFRLPSEWEWEFASSGGKNWQKLNYFFSGTVGSTAADLEQVAVNKVSPNKANSVAAVGGKLPNALGLYDMSGNVWEWCSGLGYNGYESTPGYLSNNNSWLSNNRPFRGGSWNNATSFSFEVSYRSNQSLSYLHYDIGFRLAL